MEKTQQKPEVRIGKKVKRVSLQRYLVGQVVWEVKSSDFRTLAGLMDNQLWLEQKARQDSAFLAKYGLELDSLAKILKEVRFDRGFTIRALLKIRKKLSQLEHFVPPQRNYPDFKSKFENAVQLHAAKPLGKLKKFLPPDRYIGIGYSDKGQAKDPATDGSPSWQEVASSKFVENQQIVKEIRNAHTPQELKDILKRHFIREEEN